MARSSRCGILWNESAQADSAAIRKVSRGVPAASASVIQRGALPRPVQVAWVSGWRYFGAITRLVAAPALRGAAEEGERPADLRLKAAATVEIHEPDDMLLAGVITKLFADRQVEVEPHVVQYLVRRIERSLATAMRVVERLDRAALEQKSRITRALAAEAVSAMDEGQGELDL